MVVDRIAERPTQIIDFGSVIEIVDEQGQPQNLRVPQSSQSIEHLIEAREIEIRLLQRATNLLPEKRHIAQSLGFILENRLPWGEELLDTRHAQEKIERAYEVALDKFEGNSLWGVLPNPILTDIGNYIQHLSNFGLSSESTR